MTSKEIIQKICKDNDITIRMLAQVSGLPEQYLYDINAERVQKITAPRAGKIAHALPQYPPMWLMTGNDVFLTSPSAASMQSNSVQEEYDKDKTIAELRAEVATLKEQVTNLTQAVLNLSSK